MSIDCTTTNSSVSNIVRVHEQEDSNKVICSLCDESIDDDQSHYSSTCLGCNASMCSSCVRMLVSRIFYIPEMNYPPLCCQCAKPLDATVFDKLFLDEDQYRRLFQSMLSVFWSKNCLLEDEHIAHCPFCPYLEIHSTEACPIHFLQCKNPCCQIKSCLICHLAVDDDNMKEHQSKCIELSLYKKMIEDAIDLGSQRRCPHCGLTGVKDEGCTHMTCQRCSEKWCYFCGMMEYQCPVPDGHDLSLSAHNVDWHLMKTRCPMNLNSIHEIDPRWPDDEMSCLEYFHKYHTLTELNRVYKILGENTLHEINRFFHIIDASGYTIEQIRDHQNDVLIQYPVQSTTETSLNNQTHT